METTNLNSTEDKALDQPMRNSYASEVWRRQYLNKRTADVFFTFDGSSERVPAHKSVLVAASDVFDKMFYGPMAVHGDVSLPGKSPEAFKNFLQFCYLDEVGLNSNNVTDVMSLLNEYQIKEGLEVCGQFLTKNWNVENICSVFDWAINLQMDKLQAFCERKIGAHITEIFKTEDFLSCSFNVLDHILALESLECDESLILGACFDWARHQCKQIGKDANDMENLREYLINKSSGVNLLCKIRFGSIDHKEFLTHFDSNDGLFVDANEREDMMRLLLGSKNLKTGKFQTEPRKSSHLKWNEHTVQCVLLPNSRIDQKTFHSKRIVNVLTVDGIILLEGFCNVPLFAMRSYTSSTSFPAEFSIKELLTNEQNESKTIYTDRLTFRDDQEFYFQLIPNAMVLKPGFEYHFEFCFESSNIKYDRFKMTEKVKFNAHNFIYVRSQGKENHSFIIKKLRLKSLK